MKTLRLKTAIGAMLLAGYISTAISGTGLHLLGTWISTDAAHAKRMTFYPDGTFALEVKKEKLPTYSRFEGAYQTSADQCTLTLDGKVVKAGNLWLAQGSTRCCYVAQMTGPILVLDALTNSSVYGSGCSNQTLTRQKEK
jgi:hypothetical protein